MLAVCTQVKLKQQFLDGNNMVILWVILSLVFMSFVEYSIHRWAMHDYIRPLRHIYWKHLLHHYKYFSGSKFQYSSDPAAQYISIQLSPVENTFGSAIIWLPIMYFLSFTAGMVLASTFFVHAIIWTAIHTEMHFPQGKWFVGLGIYQYLRNYHYAHHMDTTKNFNVVLPWWDWLLGTKA